jgi:membrane protein YdbS with pleckstrin-like domain
MSVMMEIRPEHPGPMQGDTDVPDGSDPTPMGPPTTVPAAEPVTLFGEELAWNHVSPRLRGIRLTVLALCLTPLLVASALVAALVTPWAWIGFAVLAVLTLWSAWVIHRQVSAITWIELPDELVIRKGRLFRTLVSLPYGRLQYVDVQSGPLMRARGLASCEFHTASPQSGGSLPGLTTGEAEDLRTRLAARGEAQRAGL